MYYIVSNHRFLLNALADDHNKIFSSLDAVKENIEDGQYVHSIEPHGVKYANVSRTVEFGIV